MKRIIIILISVLFIGNVYSAQLHDRSRNVINPATSDSQSTGNASLGIIAGDTTSMDGKVSTESKQDDTISQLGDIESKQDDIITELQTNTVVNAANSTTTPLLGTASTPADIFTGTAIDMTSYVSGIVAIFADQDSATDGLDIQYSTDGTNWDHTGSHAYTIMANEARGIEFGVEAKYVRIVYTNGAAAQGTFRMQTLLSKGTVNLHVHAIEYIIDGSHPAPLGRTVLTAQRADTTYDNIGSTNGNNLKISLEELESGISSNTNTQLNITPFSSSGEEYKIDANSNTLVGIDYEHHKCHNGLCYFASFGNDVAGAGEQTCIAFNTGASGPKIHMVMDASAGLESIASIYENTSIDVDEGTEQNPFNRDRDSVNISTVTSIETTPVVNTVTTYNETQAAGANITITTEIFHEHIGVTGAPTTRSGGISRGQSEYKLSFSQQYAFCITAIDINAQHHNVRLYYYEHTNE